MHILIKPIHPASDCEYMRSQLIEKGLRITMSTTDLDEESFREVHRRRFEESSEPSKKFEMIASAMEGQSSSQVMMSAREFLDNNKALFSYIIFRD